MREIKDVDFFLMRGQEERILKVLLNLDMTKPLRRQLKIADPNKKIIEVQIKYERIGSFCNYCGMIDHQTKVCNLQIEDSVKRE
ncbi:hypothetical protein AHAS_Ahas02G0109400 [Arachis hypogaea]